MILIKIFFALNFNFFLGIREGATTMSHAPDLGRGEIGGLEEVEAGGMGE